MCGFLAMILSPWGHPYRPTAGDPPVIIQEEVDPHIDLGVEPPVEVQVRQGKINWEDTMLQIPRNARRHWKGPQPVLLGAIPISGHLHVGQTIK